MILLKHILVAFLAITLAFVSSFALGLTSIFSLLLDEKFIAFEADVVFLLFTAVYTLLLWSVMTNTIGLLLFWTMLLLPSTWLVLWILLF